MAPLAPLPQAYKIFVCKISQHLLQADIVLVSLINNIGHLRLAVIEGKWPLEEIEKNKEAKSLFLASLENLDHAFTQNYKLAQEYKFITDSYL